MLKHSFVIAFLIAIVVNNSIFAQQIKKNDIYRLAALGKVWGFLKYYHPDISKGKCDWDTVLTNNYDRILLVNSKDEFNSLLLKIIDNAGTVNFCPTCPKSFNDSLKINLNMGWMNDTNVFVPYVSQRLAYIYKNYVPINNVYVSRQKNVGNPIFPHERRYGDVLLPDHSYRFLAFCRFWNLINYYYPYRYLLKNWDSLFIEFIPRLYNTKTDYFYFRTMQEMAARLNDGHGFIVDRNVDYFSGRKIIPFQIRKLDTAYYIVRFVDSVLCQKAGVKIGDRVLKIDGNEVDVLINHYSRYQPASNKAYLDYRVNLWLSVVKTDSSKILLRRGRDSVFKDIKTVEISKKYIGKYDKSPWKLLNDSVGYINMGFLKQNDIEDAFKKLNKTKYLIIDSRNYPNWTIYPLANKLLDRRVVFASIAEPDYDYPGMIKWGKPMVAGKRNSNCYKGKVIFLANSNTMSQAEITIMALRHALHPVVIGTETAGAFGDVSQLPLPGGLDVYFSGLGYYYPDGKMIQQIGILPDIKVESSLKNVLLGKDEIMDRAIEYIKNGK